LSSPSIISPINLSTSAQLSSGIGSLFHRQWALWLGVAAWLAELLFGIHALAWVLLRRVQDMGTVAAPDTPTTLYYALACLLGAATTEAIVWLLRPWAGPIETLG
jgi:hypothetical protein